MPKTVGRGLAGFLAVCMLEVAILPSVSQQAHDSAPSNAGGRFALAADATFRNGLHGTLPPHISTLLGLSKEEESPVLQSAVRTGNLVQGLDVLAKNRHDIVLFVVDETAKDQSLYLTSPEGTLRRVVSVKAGVGEVARISDEDQKAFHKELEFWVHRLAPSAAAK